MKARCCAKTAGVRIRKRDGDETCFTGKKLWAESRGAGNMVGQIGAVVYYCCYVCYKKKKNQEKTEGNIGVLQG